MKKIYITLAVGLFSVWGYQAQAQAGLPKADRQYDQYAYIDAIKLYEHIALRGKAAAATLEKLGNAYYFNADYAQAGKWYGELFSQYRAEVSEPEYYYRYAQTLLNTGDQQKAGQYLQDFATLSKASGRSALITSTKDYAGEIRKNSGRYSQLNNLDTNTPYADYGSSVYNQQLLFTTARDTGSLSKREHSWTGAAFTSLYYADINSDGSVSKASRYRKPLRSGFNESSAVVSPDGQTLYFTRNNYNGKRGYSSERTTLLKLYRASWQNGKWDNVEELPFNSNEYNTAHPALSKDGRILYFVSDRPGGFGHADIWKVNITGTGFGTPENLGPQVNTEGRETFPFITAKDELYFSSDARPGLGGLDVYAVRLKPDGSVGEVQNVGEPVNSPYDDFAYYIDPQTKRGFFSSNREGGKGNDDIYSFLETRPLLLDCLQQLSVKVVDANTGNPISGAAITLLRADYTTISSMRQQNNNFETIGKDLECGALYRLQAKADNYLGNEVAVTLSEEEGMTRQTIALAPQKIEVKKGDDLFKVLDLSIIYFDFDKSGIRADAAVELEKIVAVLQQHPGMTIDVRSHTDSRGNDLYNLKLSQRRAQSTAEWIMAQGIDKSRITYKGYGETDLMNDCKNGVPCSEAQHQENRRSEFIVTGL